MDNPVEAVKPGLNVKLQAFGIVPGQKIHDNLMLSYSRSTKLGVVELIPNPKSCANNVLFAI